MRIKNTGAETGDVLAFVTGVTNVATNARSGSRSYSITNNITAIMAVPAKAEYYFRVPIKITAYGTSFRWQWFNSTNDLGSVRMNPIGLLEVYVGGTLQATGTISLQLNAYYNIEIHVKVDNSTGIIAVKVDGVPDVNFSGDTQPAALSTIDSLRIYNQTGVTAYVDDIAINDTDNSDGLNDNAWCGDGHYVLLVPNAAGDVTELTPSAGANYTCVDEIPPNGDTDYVSGIVGPLRDLYNLSTYTLLANESVLRVVGLLRSREESASGDNVRTVVKTNAVEYESVNIPVTTVYSRYEGTNYKVNPQTSAAWVQAELDALQMGPKVV